MRITSRIGAVGLATLLLVATEAVGQVAPSPAPQLRRRAADRRGFSKIVNLGTGDVIGEAAGGAGGLAASEFIGDDLHPMDGDDAVTPTSCVGWGMAR